MDAQELEVLVLKLAQEVERLKERISEGGPISTLELQHRAFVARLREDEEE